jgi:hypothetical protein
MGWRSPKQILALLLAVLVAAGLSASVVRANGMAVTMAMTHDMNAAMMPDMGAARTAAMSHADDGGCAACPKGLGDNASPMHCPPACAVPVVAVLPQELAVTMIGQMAPLFSSQYALLHGRNALPDPSPPRPSDLV